MNSSGSGNVKITVSLTWTSDNVSHVLFNGQYVHVVAEHDNMHLLKWKCANECQLLNRSYMYMGRSRGRRGGGMGRRGGSMGRRGQVGVGGREYG